MRSIWGILLFGIASFVGPAAAESVTFVPPGCVEAAQLQLSRASWLACRAPRVRVLEAERSYNRIGTPRLRRGWLMGLAAYVDPSLPTMYAERRQDHIADRTVVQLVYRLQFQKIPLDFSSHWLEAHGNVGLIAMLTLDDVTGKILFVTSVHAAGCHLEVIPTDAVPDAWLADGTRVQVEGAMPKRVERVSAEAVGAGWEITLAGGSHRVISLVAGEPLSAGSAVPLPLVPMSQLESLPVEDSPGKIGSFFYHAGPLRGHVRGAWNPLSGLTPFALLALDPMFGMDKRFGVAEETGTSFYTMWPFWQQHRSRLDRMDSLLRALGYSLPDRG